MVQEKKTSLTFATEVAAGGSGRISKEFTRDATVEHVQSRIYPGPGTDLKLKILTVTIEGNRRQIVETHGKDDIDGDDDFYEWFPSEPIQKEDELVVEFDNQDTTNPHNFRVNFTVDYVGGVRSISQLLLGGQARGGETGGFL